MKFADWISGLGVFLILIPFFLSTINRMSEKSAVYFILNLVGGVFAFWGSVLVESVPFAILEGTWAVVALLGLIDIIRKK